MSSSVAVADAVNMPSPPRSKASRTASGVPQQPSKSWPSSLWPSPSSLRAAMLAWTTRRDGSTSSIATGVFCTIVSSSNSRCTSARRCSRSASPSALWRRRVRRVRRCLATQAESEITIAITGHAAGQCAEQRVHRRECAAHVLDQQRRPAPRSPATGQPRFGDPPRQQHRQRDAPRHVAPARPRRTAGSTAAWRRRMFNRGSPGR